MPLNKKVCMLTTHHSALDDRIFYKEALSLNNAGYDVILIAPLNQDGFLTDMGNAPIAKDETIINGIKIKGFERYGHSILGLPKTWIISQWLRLVLPKCIFPGRDPFSNMINIGVEIDADIYHCHEVWSLYAGIQIKKKLNKLGRNPRLICDVHEFWSARNSKNLGEAIISNGVIRFEKKAFKHVDYLITVNHIIRGHLLIISDFVKTEVLYNCPNLEIFPEYKKKDNNETITICHEGLLSFNRGLKMMLDVMKIMKERYDKKVRLLIIGDIFGEENEYYKEEIEKYQINDIVECTGWLPYEKVGNALSKGDIGIIFMESSGNNMFSSPNKLFNYMRYGLPIIAVDHPEIRRIVLESKCGVIIKERTAIDVANALSLLVDDRALMNRLGENARKAVYEKYNWNMMKNRLLGIYEELTTTLKYIVKGI